MQDPFEKRALGPCLASAIGLGCMNLSHAYGVPPQPAAAAQVLRRALDLGVTHFDTAALYGFGANEELVGRTLADRRSQITLASKCGMQGVDFGTGLRRVIDGRPETLRQTCEASLRRLRTDVIDLYYLHRWDRTVPVEESVGALAELKRQGIHTLIVAIHQGMVPMPGPAGYDWRGPLREIVSRLDEDIDVVEAGEGEVNGLAHVGAAGNVGGEWERLTAGGPGDQDGAVAEIGPGRKARRARLSVL